MGSRWAYSSVSEGAVDRPIGRRLRRLRGMVGRLPPAWTWR